MIASLQGTVASKHKDRVVLVVNGVGYAVFVTAPTLTRIEGDVLLHTSMIVREDALSLYGFTTPAERDLFDTLLTVSGVGPRLAAAMLSTLNPDNLRQAVASERAEMLTRVPGVGLKTAKKIVLELKDKLMTSDVVPLDIVTDDLNSDVLDALIALGFSVVESQRAVQSLSKDAPQDVSERVVLALQYLTPQV